MDLATVTSPHGSVVVRTVITERQKPGAVFIPIHWTDQLASSARIDALIDSNVDPVSGQPELKHTPVRVAPFAASWYGFAISAERPSSRAADYWALARAKSGWRMELAGLSPPEDWTVMMRSIMIEPDADDAVEILAYQDRSTGQHRFAAFHGNQLTAALFIAPTPVTAARDYLADQLSVTFNDAGARYRLLAGRIPNDRPDPGPIVCACFEVGRNQILDAVASGRFISVEAVGAATRAGTNCGSCRTEIGGLIHATRIAKAG